MSILQEILDWTQGLRTAPTKSITGFAKRLYSLFSDLIVRGLGTRMEHCPNDALFTRSVSASVYPTAANLRCHTATRWLSVR